MDKAKRKIVDWLLFAYLILFPFGQLISRETVINNFRVPVHPIDLISGIFLALFIFWKLPQPRVFRHIKNFLYVALFGFILSLAIFKTPSVLVGGLYLLRLISYFAYTVVVFNRVKDEGFRRKIFNSLIVVLFAVSLFGWIQYFFFPDVRALYAWGWDDHFLRLVGTFLDPTFISIFTVFGFILSLTSYLDKKSKRYLFLLIFFLMTTAFTYARAGYLALMAGALVVTFLKRNLKTGVLAILALFVIVTFLPGGASEGVNLSRTKSIFARFGNYSEAITIFKQSPLFGVGYNNYCLARRVYLNDFAAPSHSCSGSDSSLLLILATSGVLGIVVFGKMVLEIFRRISKDVYGTAFIGVTVALAVHGVFANSYFYPWVLGFMAILMGLAIKEKT